MPFPPTLGDPPLPILPPPWAEAPPESFPIDANCPLQAGAVTIKPKLIANRMREVFISNLPLGVAGDAVSAHLGSGQLRTGELTIRHGEGGKPNAQELRMRGAKGDAGKRARNCSAVLRAAAMSPSRQSADTRTNVASCSKGPLCPDANP